MFSKLKRQISIVFIIAGALLCLIGFFAYTANRRTSGAVQLEQHTRQVIQKIEEIFILSLDVETSTRGFVITGKETSLEPFNNSVPKIDTDFEELNRLVADNSSQIELSAKLKEKINEKVAWSQQLIEIKKQNDSQTLQRLIEIGRGRIIMNDIRGLVAEMKRNEESLLKTREEELNGSLNRSLMLVLGSIVFGTAMLALANYIVRREIKARNDAEKDLRKANVNLEKNVADRTKQLSDSEKFSRAILDSMTSHIAVIDKEGTIVATNKSWKDFSGQNNSWGNGDVNGEGQNYLNVCKKVYVEEKISLESKIREVLDEKTDSFSYEYPCHSPQGKSWYLMTVNKLKGEENGAVIAHFNITDRKLDEIALKEKEEFNRTIIENSPDCVKVLEPDGSLISMNSNGMCLMEIEDFTPFVGVQWADNWQNEEHEAAIKSVEKARNGETFFFEGACDTAKGTPKWWEVTVSPIFDAVGRVNKLLVTSRDVTERKNAERERERLLRNEQQARREAEIATRLREEFMATVSHELRTPLNAILGWAKLLKSGKAQGATAEKAVETIIRSAESQNRLIEDLLDVGRMISGKLVLDKIELSAEDIVKEPLEMVRPNADAKSVELSLNIEENAKDKKVYGDPTRIRQIIWNMLNNAIKFTPENGRVGLSLSNSNNEIKIKVTDNGIGIKPDFLPYVFQRFRQDAAAIKQSGGLGLGLAIVRNLTEMHDGSVAVESEGENKGSTFTVTLPVHESE